MMYHLGQALRTSRTDKTHIVQQTDPAVSKQGRIAGLFLSTTELSLLTLESV